MGVDDRKGISSKMSVVLRQCEDATILMNILAMWKNGGRPSGGGGTLFRISLNGAADSFFGGGGMS